MDDGSRAAGATAAASAAAPPVVADEPSASATMETAAAGAVEAMTPVRAWELLVEAGVLAASDTSMVGRVERLSGGNTNITYRVDLAGEQQLQQHSFILRVFGQGTEALIDRAQEARCFHAVAAQGLGPRLLGDFRGGRIEEYIHGRALTAAEMRGPAVAAAIARKFRALHAVDATEAGLDPRREPQLFPQLRAWAKLALEECGPQFHGIDVAAFPQEVDRLEARLRPLQSPVCLCHNDLNHMNILRLDEDDGDAATKVVFIDLEYAGWNFRGFDLGNHLCEWASDFLRPDAAHLLDFGRYPSLEQRRAFAHAYLGEGEGEEAVAALVREMDEFALASHLYWGIWGLVQARISAISGFDFAVYARQRLEMYAKGMQP